jgi:uncharacterized membrane protein YkvA (DUF1232 family)
MSQPNNPIPTDKIQQMLQGFKDKASDPNTLKSIEAGFGSAFAQVKDKLGDAWQDVQTIYNMAFDKGFDMKSETKIACVGALAYLISPIDLLPERFLGPLGLADDVAVLMFALNYAKPEIERYNAYKKTQSEGTAQTPPQNPGGQNPGGSSSAG